MFVSLLLFLDNGIDEKGKQLYNKHGPKPKPTVLSNALSHTQRRQALTMLKQIKTRTARMWHVVRRFVR